MQNKDEKRFTRKNGAMLVLSLCLVGAAAVTTYYAMDVSDPSQTQEDMVDLNESPEETEAEAVVTPKAQADLFGNATEMDVDPSTLIGQNEPESEEETEGMAGENGNDASASGSTDAADAENDAGDSADASSDTVNAVLSPTVAFASTQELQWPVAGKVIMDYSMDAAVYFATLDQYKYNPALIFSAQEGAQVVAAAKGIVESITTNEETGTTIRMDLGDNYTLIYGQLGDVTVAEGDVVEEGQLLGYVAQPTKYYCEEGPNLYFAMEKDGAAEDPFLYLS